MIFIVLASMAKPYAGDHLGHQGGK